MTRVLPESKYLIISFGVEAHGQEAVIKQQLRVKCFVINRQFIATDLWNAVDARWHFTPAVIVDEISVRIPFSFKLGT